MSEDGPDEHHEIAASGLDAGLVVIRAASALQFEASQAGAVPGLEQVRDDVWALGIAMPGGHIPFSLLYLLRDAAGRIHVVDPGSDSAENWQCLISALERIGADVGSVGSITATHLHPDHLGMAGRLQAASGAPLQMHIAEQRALAAMRGNELSPLVIARQLGEWEVPVSRRAEMEHLRRGVSERPVPGVDRVVSDGDRLDIPGFDLTVMHTPGHTSGHLCLRDDERSLIVTGDHVLPTMHAGIGLGGRTDANPLADYLASLRAVAVYPDHEVLPGHGYRFIGLGTRARESAEHHLRRSREVAAALDDARDLSIWQIAERLTWTAGWENLSGFFLYSALSQTAMHKAFVEGGGLDRFAAMSG